MADNKMVLLVLKRIGEKIEAEKEYLTELDQPIGDSDHGINLPEDFRKWRINCHQWKIRILEQF